MECQNIIRKAKRLIGESISPIEDDDLDERCGYILASLFSELSSIDKKYRKAHSMPPQPSFHQSYVEASSEFPLCDKFSKAAEFYLAAFLIEADEERSDLFYEKYCDSICSITNSLLS